MRTPAQHYADALAEVAVAENAAAQVRKELADFMAVLRESPELSVLLGNPAVSRASKQGVIEALVKRMGASRIVRNFLYVVLDRRRMALLPEIQRAFDEQLDRLAGITRADVTSARELNDSEKGDLLAALRRLSGQHVEAQYRQDASLIAGAVVRIGSTIYDGSVRTQLERLRARLAAQ